MKDIIKKLEDNKAKTVLTDFFDVYLDKGFGEMNKTEIETLFYHVLKKNGLLSGKCFEDSFVLKITEAKARKLIYESQVKYSNRDKNELLLYLRKSVGECLTRAYFSNNNKTIKFAIEDKYLRIALNAYLREHDYFADTSFNTDIVSIDENAFVKVVTLLVPNYQTDEVMAKLKDVATKDETKVKFGEEILRSIVGDIFSEASVEGLKKLGKWMLNLSHIAVAVAAL